MKAYFDRNIFADIKKPKDSKSAANIALLQNAVSQNRLKILLSTTVLEETLPALRLSPSILKQELEVIFCLVEKRRMIKTPADLLREAVQSYALGRSLPDMLTRTPRVLENFLVTGKVSQVLVEFVDATIRQGGTFTDNFTEAFSKVKKIDVGSPDDFQEFCSGVTPAIILGLARQHNVYEKCLERGLDRLLEVKTVRLYVTYYAAWAFSKWFGEQGVPGKVKASERGDFFHSVQAAAADVFVTGDRRLARWLDQIVVKDFAALNFEQVFRSQGSRCATTLG